MCGRIVQVMPPDEVAKAMDAILEPGLSAGGGWAPRWNLPPTEIALIVAQEGSDRRVERALWGLPGGPEGRALFNARAETVDRLASFRGAFRTGRVVVPVDAFYEWENPDHLATLGRTTAPAGRRQPWAFLPTAGPLFAFAAISLPGVSGDGEPMRAFSLITTEANGVVGAIHDRMPAMVSGGDLGRWLDPGTPREELFGMLGPSPDSAMIARRVSTAVSNARNEGAGLLDEVLPEPRLF